MENQKIVTRNFERAAAKHETHINSAITVFIGELVLQSQSVVARSLWQWLLIKTRDRREENSSSYRAAFESGSGI